MGMHTVGLQWKCSHRPKQALEGEHWHVGQLEPAADILALPPATRWEGPRENSRGKKKTWLYYILMRQSLSEDPLTSVWGEKDLGICVVIELPSQLSLPKKQDEYRIHWCICVCGMAAVFKLSGGGLEVQGSVVWPLVVAGETRTMSGAGPGQWGHWRDGEREGRRTDARE